MHQFLVTHYGEKHGEKACLVKNNMAVVPSSTILIQLDSMCLLLIFKLKIMLLEQRFDMIEEIHKESLAVLMHSPKGLSR